MALCRCCETANASRARGLCYACYHTPGVREMYQSTSPHANRGVCGENVALLPLPEHPTSAPPGSPQKVAVLEQRALLGQALWHPQDSGHSPWEELRV